jgi:NAD(P)-dependent dehydrogenase (short-subunit alcohol dehydrogenase family)
MLLENKKAVVAGIGPGLGRESALALASAGADIALIARSNKLTEDLGREIRSLGRRALVLQGSITETDFCNEVATRTRAEFGGVDILVNNAFYQGAQTSILEADMEEWRQVMEVNVIGLINMVRALTPSMQSRGGGSIIMVNSDQAYRVVPGFAAYSASKGALINVTRHLAMELGGKHIRVNGIHPGMIMGDALRGFFSYLAGQRGTTPEEVERSFAAETALGYIPDAAEMAGTVVFLASELAKPITGQSIGINAGAWFH